MNKEFLYYLSHDENERKKTLFVAGVVGAVVSIAFAVSLVFIIKGFNPFGEPEITQISSLDSSEVEDVHIGQEDTSEEADGFESTIYPTPIGVSYTEIEKGKSAPDWSRYDELIAEIKATTDMEKRVAMMHEAEDILMGTAAVIPLYYYEELGTYFVIFNVNSPIFEGKTVDQAIAMRKAFAILIDRPRIVEYLDHTGLKVATSFIPAGMADGNGGIFKGNSDSYTFPVEDQEGYYPEEVSEGAIDEAIALLEYAGYKFDDSGMLSESTPINITYLTNDGTGHIGIAKIIQQDLAEIGVNMKIDTREWNLFLDERKQGNFDFARGGWLADFNDPINMLEMWTADSGNNDCQFGR